MKNIWVLYEEEMAVLTPYRDGVFDGTHKGFSYHVVHVERKNDYCQRNNEQL